MVNSKSKDKPYNLAKKYADRMEQLGGSCTARDFNKIQDYEPKILKYWRKHRNLDGLQLLGIGPLKRKSLADLLAARVEIPKLDMSRVVNKINLELANTYFERKRDETIARRIATYTESLQIMYRSDGNLDLAYGIPIDARRILEIFLENRLAQNGHEKSAEAVE